VILIVDDSTDFLGTATAFLSSCGYLVLAARDIPGATELIHRIGTEIEVVLIDLTLGKESGFELIRLINSMDVGPPMIAFSATSSPPVLESAVLFGAQETLQKPVDDSWQTAIERVRRRTAG